MEVPSTLLFGPVPSRRLGRSLGINNVPDHKYRGLTFYRTRTPSGGAADQDQDQRRRRS